MRESRWILMTLQDRLKEKGCAAGDQQYGILSEI